MLFNNLNPFAGKKNPEEKLACYFYNRLWDTVISLYEWKGELFDGPEATLNRDYLEWCLMTQGQAGFFLDKDKKLRALTTTKIGLDCYGFPQMLMSANPVLGKLEGTIGKDAVWVRNNKFAKPVIETIAYYAGQMAKIQTSLNVNLNNCRTTKVYVAEDDGQAQQIRKFQDDVSAGKDAVIMKQDLFDSLLEGKSGNGFVPVFSTPSEYLTDKYLQDMRSVMNDFFVAFGVNASGANIIKKERNLVDEVNSNNQEIMVNRAFWLETRQKACEEVKELFGVEISVDVRQEKIQEVSEDAEVRQSEPSEE